MADDFPWSGTGKIAYEGEYRKLSRHGSGVVNAYDEVALRLTATGSNRVVTLAPGEVQVQGFHRVLPTSQSFDAALIGTQPAAGQSRICVVVARLDMATAGITFVLVTGAPVTGTPTRPPILSDPAAPQYDLPLWSFVDTPNALDNTKLVNERSYHAGVNVVTSAGRFPAVAPVGSVLIRPGHVFVRTHDGGAPEWVESSKPPRYALTRTGSPTAYPVTSPSGAARVPYNAPITEQTNLQNGPWFAYDDPNREVVIARDGLYDLDAELGVQLSGAVTPPPSGSICAAGWFLAPGGATGHGLVHWPLARGHLHAQRRLTAGDRVAVVLLTYFANLVDVPPSMTFSVTRIGS